jgi:hypothetical protein
MNTVLMWIGAWCLVSLGTGLLIGAVIKFGARRDPRPEDGACAACGDTGKVEDTAGNVYACYYGCEKPSPAPEVAAVKEDAPASSGKTFGIRMAKAREADIEAAFEMAGVLESLGHGRYPSREGDEDAPMHFNSDDYEHLQYLHQRLIEIEEKGSLFRVVGGLDTLLNPANAIVDPDDDCIALHPRFTAQTGALTVAGWIHEDELPEGYPYDAMFPHSKVDVVRMFPVYAPAQAVSA